MTTCPHCNAQLPDGSAFCVHCGNAVPAQPAYTPQQNALQPTQAYWQQPGQQQGAYQQQPGQQQGTYQQAGAYQQQPGQQQPYGQAQYVAPQAWPAPDTTSRAYAMVLYASGLLGVIFGLVVRDRGNAFITHHLNNAVVILIGSFIGGLLSVIVIGFFLLVYLLVMAIMGMVSAYNGDQRELPLIGKIHIVK